MNRKTLFTFSAIVLLILLSSFASGVSAAAPTVVATDDKNDVIEYSYSGSGLPSVKDGQSKDVVDIVSLSYGLDSNNNATITLTLAGTPNPDNSTFYWVELSSDSENLTAFAWSGAYDASSSQADYCSSACSWMSLNDGFAYSNTSAVIDGKSITWTLPRGVQTFEINYTDYSVNYREVNANLTATPGADWSWSVLTWTGTIPYTLTDSSTQSGTWWEDSLDWSSTNSTNGNNTSSSGGVPGLEVVPVVFTLTASAFVAIFEKRRRN